MTSSQFKLIKTKDGEEYLIEDPHHKKNVTKKIYEILLKQSDIPSYYWDIEFKDYRGDKSKGAVERIIYYASHFHEEKFNYAHLYLYGENSGQKTALACNIGKEALRRGFTVKFILAGSLIDKLLKVQGFNYHEELEEELEKLKNHNVIIIDDIFDEKKSLLWSNKESSNIIISAWDIFLREVVSQEKKKLVLTSNIPIEMIQTKFGTSMYELIYRNFISLGCYDSIKQHKKQKFDNLFEDINVEKISN